MAGSGKDAGLLLPAAAVAGRQWQRSSLRLAIVFASCISCQNCRKTKRSGDWNARHRASSALSIYANNDVDFCYFQVCGLYGHKAASHLNPACDPIRALDF